jgi:hypothetical protein
VLFLDPSTDPKAAEEAGRRVPLAESYELAQKIAQKTPAEKDKSLRRSILNRQPVSIVISKAYIPASLKACVPRASDIVFGKGRDIAVLLEVATATNEHQFIAVWYQRDVKPGDDLNFRDLLVYSRDAWDSKFPPFFRIRLVDVSAERNTGTENLLKQINGAAGTITALAGAPEATPLLGIAGLVGDLVLAHEKNIPLVDFTFQLFAASTLDEAGGVPLGVLQTGGVIVTAPPCGLHNDYWEEKLQFDYRLNRVEGLNGAVREQPYVTATILSSDLSVPQIVRTRADAILKRLTDPQVVQTELLDATNDATKLVNALAALSERETFRKRPTKDTFATLVTKVTSANLDAPETEFYLDNFYQVTGITLPDFAAYGDWLTRCSANATFDEQAAKFHADKAVMGTDGKSCWPN